MKLHWSPRSPFVRKVMIVLNETGLRDRVECVRSTVAFAAPPNEVVLADNPLGKIPTLVLDGGIAIFDSTVICEYLDGLHAGRKFFPEDPDQRLKQLRWQALGDGMTDMLLLWRTELTRSSGPDDVIVAAFERKLRAVMARLEVEAGELMATPLGIGQTAIVCALGQLDFRFIDNRWQQAFPSLAVWHETMLNRPSIQSTIPRDDPSPAKVNANFDASAPIIDFMGT